MGAKKIVGAKIVQELSKAYSVNNSTWRFEKSDVEPKSDVLPYRMPLSLSSFCRLILNCGRGRVTSFIQEFKNWFWMAEQDVPIWLRCPKVSHALRCVHWASPEQVFYILNCITIVWAHSFIVGSSGISGPTTSH